MIVHLLVISSICLAFTNPGLNVRISSDSLHCRPSATCLTSRLNFRIAPGIHSCAGKRFSRRARSEATIAAFASRAAPFLAHREYANMAETLDALGEFAKMAGESREYWIAPLLKDFDMLCKGTDTSVGEIAVSALAAGMVVEFIVAVVAHPFDTIKTRLQADPKTASVQYPTFQRLYDGFGPVALTVPVLSIFWATRDVVRTTIVATVKQGVSWPLLDTIALGIGTIMGESIYWIIKTPGEILKTEQQADAMQLGSQRETWNMSAVNVTRGLSVTNHVAKDMGPEREWNLIVNRTWYNPKHFIRNLSVVVLYREQQEPKRVRNLLLQVLKAWPVLAIVDVPFVTLRVLTFVALHNSGLVPTGVVEDTFIFAIANVFAVVVTTPLDVIRTQMLLRKKSIQDLPFVFKDLYGNGGISQFLAGWSPRLLYNGLIIGLIWGLVRQGYAAVRAMFMIIFRLCVFLPVSYVR